MKLRFLLAIVLLPLALSAQNLTDLNSPVYRDLERWEVQGVLGHLPLLRPYGGIAVRGFLEEVVRNGTPADRERAEEYLSWLNRPLGLPSLEFRGNEYLGSTAYFGERHGSLHFQGLAGEVAHVDGHIDTVMLQTTEYEPLFREPRLAPWVLPAGQTFGRDWFVDQTLVRVNGQFVALTPGAGEVVSWGTPDATLQLGTSRTSYGAFLGDGIVLSPQAVQAPQAAFTWTTDTTILSFATLALTASDWTGIGRYAGKFLSLSSLQWEPATGLELQLWQTAVYGQRFALEYWLPSIFFLASEQNDNYDNQLLGGGGKLRVAKGLEVAARVYLDDFQIMKFLFSDSHTGLKAGLEASVDWQPMELPGVVVRAGYAAVTPYTYTHVPDYIDANRGQEYRQSNGIGQAFDPLPNYLDYSHSGRNLGLSLGPDSDRLAVEVDLPGPAGATFTWSSVLTRHGNASEGVSTTAYPYLAHTSAGTVFDHGFDLSGGGQHLFAGAPFLGQATIETHAQSTLAVQMPFAPGTESWLKASVSAEYAWNRALVAGDDGWRLFAGLGFSLPLF